MKLKLRIALVVGKGNILRRAVTQFLKNQGWIVHAMDRIELAVPILPLIPYNLVVIDSEVFGSGNKALRPCMIPRIGEQSRQWFFLIRELGPLIKN